MRSFALGRRLLVGLLVVALGNPVLAETTTSQAPRSLAQMPTADVVLTGDGLLVGQVVDRSGRPLATPQSGSTRQRDPR